MAQENKALSAFLKISIRAFIVMQNNKQNITLFVEKSIELI